MENKKLIYFFGILFSILFSLIYYGLFQIFFSKNDHPITLYFQQLGIYRQEENASKFLHDLQSKDINATYLKSNENYIVVFGITDHAATTAQNKELLEQNNITYLNKTITLNDENIIKLWKEQQIEKVLEHIYNENKTNEQTRTPS